MNSFDHKEIEKKWQAEWERLRLNDTPDEIPGKENYYLLTEFPYPSGNLHLGHWHAFAVPDIFARYKRMKGFNVLYPIGFDSFGLPAENAAIKRGIDPREWTYGNIDYMRGQLKSMGNSFDWSREVITSNPEYYRWTQWLFLKLYEHDLVYKAKAAVNWCESCKTVLANEQVIAGACERCGSDVVQKELEQWFFRITKYADRLLEDLDALDWPEQIKEAQRKWIGKSEGAKITFQVKSSSIEVFTTRPDTLFGATYLVIAPEHPAVEEWRSEIENWDEVEAYIQATQKSTEIERTSMSKEKTGVELKGIMATNPATKTEIPVWIADYVLAQYGTGAIMAVPAHDERDFEFAKKFHLPIREVVRGEAEFSESGNWENGIVNPYTGNGILINSEQFSGEISSDAKKIITEFVGGRMTTTYRLRDWLLSRQRYWGTPIPIVYDPEGNPHSVPEEHLPWTLPEDVTDFLPKGTSPTGTSKELVERTERIFGVGWRPEIETMDTFVDSSWYFLRYLDPHNEVEFASKEPQARWMPVDRYSGGAEHTTMHLLYSRFFYKAMTDLGLTVAREITPEGSSQAGSDPAWVREEGESGVRPRLGEPYLVRMNRGLILGPDGNKMSKSKGNVIDPDEQVARVGSDTVKMYLAFIGPYNEVGAYPWDLGGIAGIRRFLEKVWRLQEKISDGEAPTKGEPAMSDILLHRTIKKVGEDIEAFKFNTAESALMVLVNALEKAEDLTRTTYETLIVLLAPFAPHMAEEIWHILGHESSVHREEWPSFDPAVLASEERTIVVQINGKARGQFKSADDLSEEGAVDLAREVPEVAHFLAKKGILRTIYIPNRLINFVLKEG